MYYVYRFLDKSKNVIYIGKSKQELEQRFKGHSHLPEECYKQVYRIEYIECSTESDMSIKEIYYINKYRNSNFFNILDTTELPRSVEFNDKWKQYKGPISSHFPNSINFKKRYTSEKAIRYNKDGSIDKRDSHKKRGQSSFVEALTNEEVDLIIKKLVEHINTAPTKSKEQIWFRNLFMFVLGINLPLYTTDLLNLKYKDLFDDKDRLKPIEMTLGRHHQDTVIKIPLRKNVRKIILAYTQKYKLTYQDNSSEYFFVSRKHQIVSPISWGRILRETAQEAGIDKNIGAESIRKTYALNVYSNALDQLNALLFLGELWGQMRETQIIRYLGLSSEEIDFKYYLGESFALGKITLSKIHCLKSKDDF